MVTMQFSVYTKSRDTYTGIYTRNPKSMQKYKKKTSMHSMQYTGISENQSYSQNIRNM